MQRVEKETQDLGYKSMAIDGETVDLIKNHNVLTKEIKSISYRFDDSLLHPGPSKDKFKPDFKRSAKGGSKEANRTIQPPI